jgi:hypothetical protein
VEWYLRNVFAIFAAILWLCFIAAIVDMQLGNPTAINGVIGASVAATLVTVAAVMWRKLWKEDRRG